MLSFSLRRLRDFFARTSWSKGREGESLQWEDTCEALRRSDPDLHELEVDGSSVMESEWRMFTDALRFSQGLKRLILRQVDSTQCRSLAPSLKNSEIHALYFDSSDDANGELMGAISIALFYNRGIEQLHLRDCRLDPVSAPSLGFLVQCSVVSQLHLCHTVLTLDMTIALSQGLLPNTSLKLLDLSGCHMDDVMVRCLSIGFKANTGVEFLSLDFNAFGDDGVAALADMLASNQSLTELQLFGNRVTAVGAEHLSRALTTNDCLQSLILSLNRIGDRGAVALAKALTVNRTLSNLCFPSNYVGQAGMEAFAEYLPRMSGLETLNVGLLLDYKAEEALTLGLKDNLRLSFLLMEKPAVGEFDEEASLPNTDELCHNAHMDFYLRLNRSGRRLLRQDNTHPGLWAHILANTSCHARRTKASSTVPDVLYYLLRELPDLLDLDRVKVL
jgi:Leucine Rich repeat